MQEPFLKDAVTCLAAHFKVYDEYEERIGNPEENIVTKKYCFDELGMVLFLQLKSNNFARDPHLDLYLHSSFDQNLMLHFLRNALRERSIFQFCFVMLAFSY